MGMLQSALHMIKPLCVLKPILNYFMPSTDAYCPHKRRIRLFGRGFKRQHGRGCSWIFLSGDFISLLHKDLNHLKIKIEEIWVQRVQNDHFITEKIKVKVKHQLKKATYDT